MELPWREARLGLGENEGSERIIQKDRIENYFNQVFSEIQNVRPRMNRSAW